MVMARLPEPTEPVICLPSLDRLSAAGAAALAFFPLALNSADHFPSIPAVYASGVRQRKAAIQTTALRIPTTVSQLPSHPSYASHHRLQLPLRRPAGGLAEAAIRREREPFRWGKFETPAHARGDIFRRLDVVA